MAGSPDIVSLMLSVILGGTMMLGFFIILLLLKSDLGLSKYLLCATLGAMLIHLLTFLLFITQLMHQWPHMLGTTYPFIFLTGPAFYFFIKSYAEPAFRFNWQHLIHLSPVLLIAVFMLPTYFSSHEQKLETIHYYYELAPVEALSWFDWLYLNLYVVVILGYVITALVYIYRNQSYNSLLLRKFCWLFLALSVLYLILQSGFLLHGTSLITSEIILSLLMAVVILMMGYWVLDIGQLFPAVNNLRKYQTSPLSHQQAEQIQQALKKTMEEQELYLNPRLKISDMAESLQVPSHHLSQVLNDLMKTNFYQLINSYRVKRSKELLKTDRLKRNSIQGIGFDCGFSNKTSFYRAFRKITGMTPAEYAGSLKRTKN